MKFYLEITLLASVDVGLYFLWKKVYQQIHVAFVKLQNNDKKIPIGVAFPEYNKEKSYLGNKLRLFAEDSVLLESLNIKQHLNSLTDYVHITNIREVPQGRIKHYACFKRIQPKSSLARIARRKSKREAISFEQSLQALGNFQEQTTILPYIQIKSSSTGEDFYLFIDCVFQDENKGFYSSYGLSSVHTVPIF